VSWVESWLGDKASTLESRGLTRRLRVREPGDPVIDLASNDYLGLAADPRVIAGAVEAAHKWGAGATGSRLVTGTTALHADLEAALATQMRQPAALVFSSGYLANLGVITALGDLDTLLVCDAHVHASLVDACRLSRSRVEQVDHLDRDQVTAALRTRTEKRAIVITESVFSVLGDAAPLADLAEICASEKALLVVDEAHGLGVTGGGAGSVAAAGLAGADHVIVMATLSKALGSQGGAVLGSELVIAHLINRARGFIFDTALAPPSVGAALAALTVVRDEPERVAAVLANARRLATACRVAPAAGAVLSVPTPGPREAVAAAEACLAQGVRVSAFRPPSVPDGISRLRITSRATLSETELAHACTVLASV
jgi:8-amino-7-oxononanoate synthase